MKTAFKPSERSISGAALRANIENWMTTALRDNPGIIAHLYGYKGERPVPTADDKKLVPWYNEFTGKLLCGMAQSYAALPSEDLKRAGDELCAALRAAQCEDSYLGIYDENERFGQDGENWDVWGHYHIISGLWKWHDAADNSEALDTAMKAAECVWNYFTGSGRSFDSAGNQTMNLAISHVFVELYRTFKIQKYLDAAVEIVEKDWPKSGNWMNEVLGGKEYYQSSLPRWEALHTVMTLGGLWDATGNKKYFDALQAIWRSIRKTDVHNTGGFSSGEAAAGDPYVEGAIETCCTVAWMALSCEYLKYSHDIAAADALERAQYNGMLGSLMLDGRYITYNTDMWAEGRHRSQHVIGFQYNSASKEFNCCQANGAAGLSRFTEWAVTADGSDVYVDFYCDGEIELDGLNICISTDYPKNGIIGIAVKNGSDTSCKVHLRVPAWTRSAILTINGQNARATAGEYAEFAVGAGDSVSAGLKLSMDIYTEAGGNALSGAVSIYRGPILLTSDDIAEVRSVQELKCSLDDIKNADVTFDGDHCITLTVGDEKLYDFYTCGRGCAYTSWHKLNV